VTFADTADGFTTSNFALNSAAANGVATIDAAGNWTYTPSANYNGADSFIVQVTDDDGNVETQTINITVNPIDDAGTFGGNVSATTNEDTATSGTVTFADTADGYTTNNFALTSGASNGTAAIDSDGNWTYTPTANFNGADSFVVQVTDDDGNVETQTINITVSPIDDAGTFGGNVSATTNEDTGTSGTVTFADTADGFTTPNFSLNTAASNGTATINAAGDWTYTPTANYNGADSFIVQVTDDDGNVETQTINITVSQIDDAGTFGGNVSATTNEDTGTSGTVTFVDTADGFTTPNFSLNTAATNGVAAIDAAGNWTYTPSANYNGADSFIVQVTDDDGNVETQTINITVSPVNDTAVIAGNDTGSVQEDIAVVADNISTSGTLTITDPDSGESSFQAATVGGTYGDLTIDTAGNWSYSADNTQAAIQALDLGESLTDTLTVSAFDGTTHNVVITINGSEDAAVISGTTTGSVAEDGTLTSSGALTISDTDTSDSPSFANMGVTAGDNGYGTFEMTAGTWTYTLNNVHPAVQALDVSETLTDTFTFSASDGSLQLVTVTINGAEDAPVFDSSAVTAATEDVAYSYTITTSDVDVESVTITAPTLPAWLTLVDNGDGTATLSGTPSNAEVGNHNVVLNVSDGALSRNQNFTITVSNANDLPVIGGIDTGVVTEDQVDSTGKLMVAGALTVADPDIGESSFVAETIQGSFGAMTIDASGNWSYSADNSNAEIQALQAGESMTEILTVTTADGSTHDVEIIINGSAEAPPAPPPTSRQTKLKKSRVVLAKIRYWRKSLQSHRAQVPRSPKKIQALHNRMNRRVSQLITAR
jgi:VCBS repeat-containing protein